jgi:hypothetical protein
MIKESVTKLLYCKIFIVVERTEWCRLTTRELDT